VILDSDLAQLYGVTTSRLNEQVKRNLERFPSDFVFRLNRTEFEDLISQIATSSSGYGGRRKLPLVFTEHGAIMAANVLNGARAVEMSVYVVRAFVKLRSVLSEHIDLARELAEVERQLTERLDVHEAAIVEVLRRVCSYWTHLLRHPIRPGAELDSALSQSEGRTRPSDATDRLTVC
jgi:ORF6N domain